VLEEDSYDTDEESAKELVENAEKVLGYEDPGLEPDLYQRLLLEDIISDDDDAGNTDEESDRGDDESEASDCGS